MNQLSLTPSKPKVLLNSSLDTSVFMKSITDKPNADKIASCSVIQGSLINFDTNLSVYAQKNSKLITNYPTKCSELVDSETWLKNYGLKTNKLNFQNILSMIGFKQTQDYMNQLNKSVTSKYSGGLFVQSHTKDGLIYNITVDEKKLEEFAIKLQEALDTYRLRLQWLNSDSRRLFGVIVEKGICLVLDCKDKDNIQFNQYRNCVLKLLREQISKIASFNIVRCCGNASGGIETFKDQAVVVSAKSINDAIDWLNDWNRKIVRPVTDSTTCEAVMKAFSDQSIEAIYLICEGISANGTREILYDKLVKESFDKKIKLNVISYNCNEPETIEYLKRLSQDSYGPGRFHAYCLLKQIDDFAPGPIDADPTVNRVIVNKRSFGGAPPGSGVKTDLLLIFEEIQNAKETLDNLNELLESMKRINSQKLLSGKSKQQQQQQQLDNKNNQLARARQTDDEYLTSKEWLIKYGLVARKLDLFDALNTVGFRHCDGVVDLKKEPITGKVFFVGEGKRYYQGDALPREKLVNARYCDQFAHVLWNDGRIMHVHVTPDLHRSYEQKINMALEQFERRIDWLSKGSRELFGTVIENSICILIDTSQSMQTSLEFIKRKLSVLMNEQLKSKQRFNLLAFNTKVYPWRDRLVEVDEFNMKNALDWINGLNAQGSTNTLGAIRFALGDLNTEAIYLLSDGRPDQDPRQILSQINLNNKVPIHTISFNCNDTEANKFLSQLARETNGRYHYFNENDWDADPDGAVPYLSEDISLLKKEIENGLKYLNQIEDLRDECSRLANPDQMKKRSDSATSTSADPMISETKLKTRFQSKYNSKASFNLSKSSSFVNSQGVLSGLNDIQSLEWILPETRGLLERQFKNEIMRPRRTTSASKQTNVNKKRKANVFKKKIESIKQWLKKNSLTALKLTILDALEPYIVNTSASSNDAGVLEEDYVDSKAWNDILEFAHISNTGTVKFKLLNPVVINFKKYDEKVENQILVYQKYIAEKIWNSLTTNERQNLELTYPFEFNEKNREKLLRALEYADWPVNKEDIESLEYQIYLAEIFLQQSKDLHNYLKEKDLLKKQLVNVQETSVVIKEDFSYNKKISLDTNRTEEDTETLNETKPNLIKRDSVRNKDLMRNLSANSSINITNKDENISKELKRGNKVIARNDLVGYFYSARVHRVHNSRHVDIKFDDTDLIQHKMSLRNVIKTCTSSASAYFSAGDYVMAKVINEFDEKCWVPGIIQSKMFVNKPCCLKCISVKMFRILFFNGQEGDNAESELIKINKYSYGFIVNYIRAKLGISSNVMQIINDNKHDVKSLNTVGTETERDEETFIDSNRHVNEEEINLIKSEIVNEIKVHFDSLKLDTKYQKMYEEFSRLRKNHKSIKENLSGELKRLKKEFIDFKSREPQLINLNATEIVDKLSQNLIEANSKNKQLIVHVKEDDKKSNKSDSLVKTPTPTSTPIPIPKRRRSLPELNSGQQVLVRWPDDGWYYISVIRENLGNFTYKIEDSLKDVETVHREDIISNQDNENDSFEPGDTVIALHPEYEYSYAPGQVIKTGNDMSNVLIKFYDFIEKVVPSDQVFKLDKDKFQTVIDEIIRLEKRWIGKTVVARNNISHVYELGRILNQNGNIGRQYVIEWANGKQSIQNANHIFGHDTRKPNVDTNDYVIAPVETVFMPGRVIARKKNQLKIKFVNGIEDSNVNYDDCFWISRNYYEDARNFIARNNKEISTDSDDHSTIFNQHQKLSLHEKPVQVKEKRDIPVVNARALSNNKINYQEMKPEKKVTTIINNEISPTESSSDTDSF